VFFFFFFFSPPPSKQAPPMHRLVFLALFAVAFVPSAYALLGLFTVNCAPLTTQRADPIINPGVAGTHVHSVIGGNAFSRKMKDTDGKLVANATTCNKVTDHSNYWVPQLYHIRADGKFELVPFSGSAIYYQRRACDYAPNLTKCDENFRQLAPPEGLHIVAGEPMRRIPPVDDHDFENTAIDISCIDGTSGERHGFPISHCRQFRSQVYFPSCWDGVNVDTPDHKAHMSYPAIGNFNFGICPKSHPKAIFSIFFEFYFETGNFTDMKFAFSCGDPTGFGFHGDFFMGWTNHTALQNAHDTCETVANCPELGNKGQTRENLVVPAVYEEDIGLTGAHLDTLPGNNPLTWPPGYTTWPEKSLSIPSYRSDKIIHRIKQ